MQSFISKFDDGVCEKDNLLILGSGEPYKTIESVLTIVRAAFEANFTRKDIFLYMNCSLEESNYNSTGTDSNLYILCPAIRVCIMMSSANFFIDNNLIMMFHI